MYALNQQKFLTDDEFDKLIEVLTRFYPKDPRNTLMFLLAANTGARASEVRAIRKIDLHEPTQTVFIKGLKNSKDRELPIPADLFAKLSKFSRELQPNERLFPIALRTMEGIWYQYRPVKKALKSLRHTFALRLYRKTKDLRLVKTALGHKSVLNTMIYADYVYNQEELRKLLL